MLHILWSIIAGFIIGFIAKHLYHPAEALGFWMTVGLGIAGSIIGGLIARLFSKPAPGSPVHPAGCIMSVLGAIVLLFVISHFH
jgi:uncharacterized membrane protein YeaQ/YmgE (transglycosylase-associated protein family)